MKYIIEHLEPKLYPWCILEYTHISQIVGKEHLLFTNISSPSEQQKLKSLGIVHNPSIRNISLPRACILDPFAKQPLTSKDTENFDYIIIGGILGDHPMQARTKQELSNLCKTLPTRHLGKEQLPTDNAVYIAKEILEHRQQLSDFHFQDTLEIDIEKGESIILPFRYVLINNKPLLAKGFKEFLKKQKMF
ncbi:hypothetical protein HYX11_04410 [Candidatus Woesearchaeota archaeon]|nr:hypothetical protein [Candidatus Woesearchaeota archaeon]